MSLEKSSVCQTFTSSASRGLNLPTSGTPSLYDGVWMMSLLLNPSSTSGRSKYRSFEVMETLRSVFDAEKCFESVVSRRGVVEGSIVSISTRIKSE